MADPLLALSSVVKEIRRAHRRVRVVDGVSLDVVPGEIVGLVGPAGAGTTALLRLAAGITVPDAGTVRLAGAPPARTRARRLVGLAPSHPVFPPTLTVKEVLDYYARFHAVGIHRRALARRALELGGLGPVARERVAVLPENWIARLAFAQAALGGRPLLLLDQTLSRLDPLARREVTERLVELAADGTAILIASHELSVLERLAARVVILRRGVVAHAGPLAALLRQRVLEVVLDRPVEQTPPGFRATPVGLETDLGAGTVEAALALCRAHRLAVRASHVRVRSLEDVVVGVCERHARG